jgi:hypothetical protein
MGQAVDAAVDTTTMIMMKRMGTGNAMGMGPVAAMDTVHPVQTMLRRIRKRIQAGDVAAADVGHKIPYLIGFLFILDIEGDNMVYHPSVLEQHYRCAKRCLM